MNLHKTQENLPTLMASPVNCFRAWLKDLPQYYVLYLNNHKFRHIGVNTGQYRQSFSPKTIGAWNQLLYADSQTLESFRRNLLFTVRPYRYAPLGALLSNQPEPVIIARIAKYLYINCS